MGFEAIDESEYIDSGQTYHLRKSLNEHDDCSIHSAGIDFLLRRLLRLLNDTPAIISSIKNIVASMRLFNVHSNTISWSSCDPYDSDSFASKLCLWCANACSSSQGRCSNARNSKELDHTLRRCWSGVGPESETVSIETMERQGVRATHVFATQSSPSNFLSASLTEMV